jgi:NAD(P)H dehydrogenase (quinone)
MKAHIILAHPDSKSFNANLANVARNTLSDKGWEITISDLYSMGFDPCERAEHYGFSDLDYRFDVQSVQRDASKNNSIPPFVKEEIDRLDNSDLVIFQYPMWWHLPPAILKGWFDRVFAYGEVYASKKRFEKGRFVGKKALISVTVGTSEETYHHNGRSGDINLMLWPIHFTIAYVGFSILNPYIAYGVEAGLRYSDDKVVTKRLKNIELEYAERLSNFEQDEILPFNKMSEWGNDGHIIESAPVYTPFIRHNKELEL